MGGTTFGTVPAAAPALGVAHSFIHTIDSLPYSKGDLVMMSFATGGVRDMLDNWVRHVRMLKLPILVAAMDAEVIGRCNAERFDCYSCVQEQEKVPRYIRGDFSGFRALGVRKVDALLPILRRGVHVVLSDVDCVWLHDPNPMVRGLVAGYEDFAHADLIVSTDCHNPQSDYDSDGCFGDLLDKNTGVMAIRATPNGIASMAEWRVRLAMGLKDEQDQTTFMDLVDGNGRGHRWGMTPTTRAAFKAFARGFCGANAYVKGYPSRITRAASHTPGSRRIYNVCLPNVTTDLRLGIFPITEVANGHTFFVQQLQTMSARWPMAVHATFQYGDMPDYAFGKRQRFRDWGMWLVDDEQYTSSTTADGGDVNYLVLEEDETPPPGVPWLGMADLHARGRQHLAHLERTRQRLAGGVALARALNRTVVLPHMWCYCDKYWHRLEECAVPNSVGAQPLPFICPMDHVVEPMNWHGDSSARVRRAAPGQQPRRADGPPAEGMPFRTRRWLTQLGAYPHVGLAAATLASTPVPAAAHTASSAALMTSQLLSLTRSGTDEARRGDSSAADLIKHEFVPGSDGPRLSLRPNQSDATLHAALRVYDHVRLLRVSMSDASALLGCVQGVGHRKDLRSLTSALFQHRWCYRPKEMAANWTNMQQWCVWGFADPDVPPVCPM